jgi:leucyl aminopeptidase (aminopeptidase T)
MTEQLLPRYAELVVNVGVAVGPGSTVLVRADIDHREVA